MKFNELVNDDKPVLIDFFATWCGPCRAMSPVLEQVSKSIGKDARIVKIDIDKNPAIAQNLSIRGVPTFMIYKSGKLLWRDSGMQSAQKLTELLEENT